MDMVGEVYLNQLPKLVKDGRVTVAQIDMACKRILEAKYKLGLFADPYCYVTDPNAAEIQMKKEFRDAARDIARRSMVLLKNNAQTLPLKKTGSIALIGPLARNQRDLIGNWSGAGDWKQAVSIEQGMKNLIGNALQINYAKGANFIDDTLLIKRLNAHGGELEMDTRSSDEMIREAVQAARKSDVIVAVVGEPQGMSGEASSRADIGIPGRQLDLLKALKETGKPLVLVLMNGRPLTLKWENDNADAILETWYAGTEAGNAIADVLYGIYNPSGKLTATFPQTVGQVPIYYNHKNTGRPFLGGLLDKYQSRYMDVTNDPLYPFGYGLSYSAFSYGDIKLSRNLMNASGSIDASVTVSNVSIYDGEEVVQLYIQDVASSVTRPVKELKNFKKVFLKAGESQNITFTVSENDLKFYDADMKYVAEPGDFKLFIGTNSRDVKEATFTLTK